MKAIFGYAFVALAGLTGVSATQAAIAADGDDLSVAEMMENCRSDELNAEEKAQCFNDLAAQLRAREQEPAGLASVQEALDGLRRVAEYQDAESGLVITGNSCFIHVLYYGNYFHISRRNVSSIDLLSAKFDASKLQLDQLTPVNTANLTWAKGLMQAGATAVSQGGMALESQKQGFDAKPAKLSLGEYATSVLGQLPATDAQGFEFMLVHPAHSDASTEIRNAFEEFVTVCQA